MPFVLLPMFFARIILCTIVFLFGTHVVYGQDRIIPSRVGVLGLYSFGSPLTFNRTAPSLLNIGKTIDGTSKDQSYGIALDLSFRLRDRWSLLFQPGYRIGQGEFISNNPTPSIEKLTVNTSYSAVDLGLLLSYNLAIGIDISSGVSVSLYPSSNATLTHSVDSVTETVAENDALIGRPFHASLPLDARFTLFDNGNVQAGVNLRGSMNLSEAIRGYASQSFSIASGIWIAFTSDPPPPIGIRDSIINPIRPRLVVSSRFLVDEQDIDSIAVVTFDTIITTSVALHQYIYFDHERSDINDIEGLPRLSAMLTEIGKRLSKTPSAELTIELRRNATEPISVVTERMNVIKRAIGFDRVTFITNVKPVDGLGYALLRTSDPMILAPIRTREIRQDHRADQLSIDRSTIAEAGVQEWSVTVTSGVDTLIRYGSFSRTVEGNDLSFSLPSTTSHLNLHSFVIDRAGQRSDSYDTLHVRQPSASTRQIHIDEYFLTGQERPSGQDWSFDRSLLDLIVKSSSSSIEVRNVFPSGFTYVSNIVKAVLDEQKTLGQTSKKIEVIPNSEKSEVFDQTFSNSVCIRLTR